MYIKGDYIHQSTNGLCRVEEVTTLDMAGVDKDRLYYKLTPVACQGSTVFIPVEKSAGTTRYAMTREEARKLAAELVAQMTVEEKAAQLLVKSSRSVEEIMEMCGFADRTNGIGFGFVTNWMMGPEDMRATEIIAALRAVL